MGEEPEIFELEAKISFLRKENDAFREALKTIANEVNDSGFAVNVARQALAMSQDKKEGV